MIYSIRPRNSKQEKGLYDMINYLSNYIDISKSSMIEIGSYLGESTVIFSKYFGKVITIDSHDGCYDDGGNICKIENFSIVQKYCLKQIKNHTNIEYINKTSDDAFVDLLKENIKVDFIYIDGNHTYGQVKKDIYNYKQLIKETGFIGGHDYKIFWKGVMKAVDEEIEKPDKLFKDTSWIKKI